LENLSLHRLSAARFDALQMFRSLDLKSFMQVTGQLGPATDPALEPDRR